MEKAPCMLCVGESQEVDADPLPLFAPASGPTVNIVLVTQSWAVSEVNALLMSLVLRQSIIFGRMRAANV